MHPLKGFVCKNRKNGEHCIEVYKRVEGSLTDYKLATPPAHKQLRCARDDVAEMKQIEVQDWLKEELRRQGIKGEGG